MDDETLDQILAYHAVTKHHFRAFAPGPGHLEWATQPDPFRRYVGAALIPLARPAPADEPPYEAGFRTGQAPPAPVDFAGVSRLFFDSLALAAWKEYQGSRWALRVNPSSGNLHPTEGYLVCGPIPGLCETPLVAHYAPQEHALEVRATFPLALWQALVAGLPPTTLFCAFTSIHWREAWKYGERAYRYCQHDVGHALAAASIAAAGLGWRATLLDGLGTDQLATLLGVADPQGAEPEQPDCLLAIAPAPDLAGLRDLPDLPTGTIEHFRTLAWSGRPNVLSPSRVEWPWVAQAAEATHKPPTPAVPRDTAHAARFTQPATSHGNPRRTPSLRRIIHQRRSAVEMDGRTFLEREAFYHILARTLPGLDRVPFNALPWRPHVHLVLFIHRVRDLEPGLFCLVRDPIQTASLHAALKPDFAWEAPPGCPADLPLYRLATGDARGMARRLSCGQDIAADGCFSLGMLAEFEGPLTERGAWFYARLFWECGMIGQTLYLEAEAAGVRGTGIGCFFDDGMHDLLGLRGIGYQSLYHFTVGGPEEDARLTTLAAYE